MTSTGGMIGDTSPGRSGTRSTGTGAPRRLT